LSDLIWNERAKLSANYANGAAVSLFAVGCLGPTVSAIQNAGSISVTSAVLAVICICMSVLPHWLARGILGRLVG
jgi:hypothetical protein